MIDKLEDIFARQKQLDQHIEQENPEMVKQKLGSDIADRIKNKCTAIIHEATELQRLTGYKWWKKNQPPLDRHEALKELVDIEHFVVSAAIDLGFTAQEFFDEYANKNAVNHSRQDNKY